MKFEGQVFESDITLDYNEFVDCEVKNCVVFYYGGNFSMVRTKFNNVRFALGGPANQTLAFLRVVRANGPHLIEELLDQGPQPVKGEQLTIN